MTTEFSFSDDLGPEKVIEIYDVATGLKAILVVDNTAAGPAIGGVRMAPDVSVGECFRLARAMTLKNAMAGLAHGGGKSVIAADPAMPATDRSLLIKAFATATGVITRLDPDLDLLELLRPRLKRALSERFAPSRVARGTTLLVGLSGFHMVVRWDLLATGLSLLSLSNREQSRSSQ